MCKCKMTPANTPALVPKDEPAVPTFLLQSMSMSNTMQTMARSMLIPPKLRRQHNTLSVANLNLLNEVSPSFVGNYVERYHTQTSRISQFSSTLSNHTGRFDSASICSNSKIVSAESNAAGNKSTAWGEAGPTLKVSPVPAGGELPGSHPSAASLAAGLTPPVRLASR